MVEAARRQATRIALQNYNITLFSGYSLPRLGPEEPPRTSRFGFPRLGRLALAPGLLCWCLLKGSRLWRRFWNIPAGSTVILTDASISENTVKGLGAAR